VPTALRVRGTAGGECPGRSNPCLLLSGESAVNEHGNKWLPMD
jgi:hypothetical protein